MACARVLLTWLPRLLVPLAASLGCAAEEEAPDESESATADELTRIPQTVVKDQLRVGNCWIYTTLAWTESLVLGAVGMPGSSAKSADISENWLAYWYWYDQIANGGFEGFVGNPDAVTQGANVTRAFELIARYGIVAENGFKSTVTAEGAVAAFDRELTSGALKYRSARLNKTLVRRTLDLAFGLPAATVQAMDELFGADGRTTLPTSGALPAASRVLGLARASGLEVRLPNPTTHAPELRRLSDALGTGNRAYAWTRVSAPSAGAADRQFLKRVQRALNDGYPLPISWMVDFKQRKQDRITFDSASGRVNTGNGGWHASLLSDYTAENVPGFGTLPAGRPETRPAALEASLSDQTVISLIRVKNSWGAYVKAQDPLQVSGYSDMTRKYYAGGIDGGSERTWREVRLPAGY